MSSSIVKSAAQQLGKLLVEEAKFLYKVRDKIESLQTKLAWMGCFLRDADTKKHQDQVLCLLVSQVRDLAYDAEDIIERYLYKVSHHRRDGIKNTLKWFSRMLWTSDAQTLHNHGSNIDDLTLKISELTDRLRLYGIQIITPTRNLEYNATRREERRTYSHTKEDVVGLDEDIKQVVDRLVSYTNINVVGISGIGGLGKTTLVRKVFKHKDIRDYFNTCTWVYISKEFEPRNIFQEILVGAFADQGGDHLNKIRSLGVEELTTQIHDLLNQRKCLIVLDDIWTEKDWNSLKPAFETMRESSSKILLTTRNQNLLQHVDPSGYPHPLRTLNFEDCWKLLKRKAFMEDEKEFAEDENTADDHVERNEMEALGREMLNHCKGLPIAIVALGGILSTRRTVYEWKDIQKNIGSYLMSGNEQGGGNGTRVSEVLELSYHDLPYYLKPCFLYLGIFPEDYIISTRKLYHLWGAEGFLALEDEAEKQGATTYDIGERYLNELVQRSLVQVENCWRNGKIKKCRVHDVIRDMCLKKCKEVSFLDWTTSATVSKHSISGNRKLRRCALHLKHRDHLEGEASKKHEDGASCLRSLLVFEALGRFEDGYLTSEKIQKSFPLIRVLDCGEVWSICSIRGVGKMIHLRYLSLRNTNVKELPPGVYDLKSLETLDLRSHHGMVLINKFDKMERLRHLYLCHKGFIVVNDEKLTFPVHLETLKNFDPLECDLEVLLQMTNLRVFSITPDFLFSMLGLIVVLEFPVIKNSGQQINSFGLRIEPQSVLKQDPTILSSLARNPNFKKLTLFGKQTWLGGTVDITEIENWGDVFPDSLTSVELHSCVIGKRGLLALEKLPHLKFFGIDGNSCVDAGCTKLSLSPGSFPELRIFRITRAERVLDELEIGEGALPNLQILILQDCGALHVSANNYHPSSQLIVNRVRTPPDWIYPDAPRYTFIF